MFVIDVSIRFPFGDPEADSYYYGMLRVEIMMWENFLIGLRESYREVSGVSCLIHVLYGKDTDRRGFVIEYVIPNDLVDFYPGDFGEVLPPASVFLELCEEGA